MAKHDSQLSKGRGNGQRGKPANSYSTSSNAFGEFVPSDLSDAEKQAVTEWLQEKPDIMDFLTFFVSKSIKISLSWNVSSNSFICAATNKDPDSPSCGLTFSSHAGTPGKALAVTLWKLEHKLTPDGDWRAARRDADEWG